MSEFLDGEKLMAWVERERPSFRPSQVGESMQRRIGKWRCGGMASVWTADELLTKLELHLSMLPDDIWIVEKPSQRKEKDREWTQESNKKDARSAPSGSASDKPEKT